MLLNWTKTLSTQPLCKPPEPPCIDDYMVNAVAISHDARRVVAGTYYKNYVGTQRRRVDGRYGVYVFDTSGTGALLFSNEYVGDEGIYAVAMSGDGAVAAGGGLRNRTKRTRPKRGLLRAFDVATGAVLLDLAMFSDRVNSVALSHNGEVLAAVTESSLYVFTRQASGAFDPAPQFLDLTGYCETVAVHPSGHWLAAADQAGTIYVVPIAGGVLGAAATWVAEEPDPTGVVKPVKFRSVAISRATDAIVAGGRTFVYYLTHASLAAAVPGPVATFSAFGAIEQDGVKWVAIADDGAFVTAVINDQGGAGGLRTGRIFKLSLTGAALTKDWEQNLSHPPNSTSIDSSGTRITAADGWPNHTPGTFYLFDALGNRLGTHATVDMNWPMHISANGAGIAAGSDDNTVFFFTP